MQFLKSYCIHKSFDLGLYWKFKKVRQRSTLNLAEILISRTPLPVQLQHGAGKFWCFIIFTRSCHLNMTYFKRSKRSDKGQHQTCPRFWYGEYPCKITKRYRQFLQSYCVHKAAWPCSKRSHKVQCQTHLRFVYREHPCKVTTWYRQSTKSYPIHKVLPDAACLKV